MELNEYQKGAQATAIYRERGLGGLGRLHYVALGLNGESGELANDLKKVTRDMRGRLDSGLRTKLQEELGDVLWYVAMFARELDTDLEDIAKGNLAKLAQRHG